VTVQTASTLGQVIHIGTATPKVRPPSSLPRNLRYADVHPRCVMGSVRIKF